MKITAPLFEADLVRIEEVILAHQKRYPSWQITDLVKLIYQNEFGCGHFISDQEASLLRLKKELASLSQSDFQNPLLFETLGNGYSRLHLNSSQASLNVETINKLFLITSTREVGTRERFEEKLGQASNLCAKGSLPFEPLDLKEYLVGYKKEGYPPVSHSNLYREAYYPSYRVVSSVFAHYFALLQNIEKLLEKKDTVVVAIDGPAGAGKSTLASLLQKVYACPVISMDHFFLQPGQRTEERLAEPGGNVDYERFQEEVLPGLRSSNPFNYRVYNCQTQGFTWSKLVENQSLKIVEGSYSLHPKFRESYDLGVFLNIDPQTQQQRILKRNGSQMLKRFIDEWIPLETRYFASCQIKEKSNLVFDHYQGIKERGK